MEKKRICLFCESWESGGIESFLCSILQNMDLSALKVDIVAANISESVFTAPLEERGIRFIPLTGSLRSPKNYGMFRHVLREGGYDAVHFNLYQGLSLYYVRLARREGVPLRIVHSHNTALRRSRGRWLKMLLHRAGKAIFAREAGVLWACSKSAAEFLFPQKLLRQRGWRFIPNGIDCDRFGFRAGVREQVRRELGISEELLIGSVGRLCEQKNQSFLLEAFAEAVKIRAEARLLLVGEGDARALLEKKARDLGIDDKVIFYGTTTAAERLMCAMDVLAFPSLFEGLGIVAVEAQACGLPVVCSENVPEEAFLSSLCRREMLSSGAQAWARALMQAAQDAPARQGWDEEIRAAGFDRGDAAKIIQDTYWVAGND